MEWRVVSADKKLGIGIKSDAKKHLKKNRKSKTLLNFNMCVVVVSLNAQQVFFKFINHLK